MERRDVGERADAQKREATGTRINLSLHRRQ